jgi:ABC-2 type transport system permease protein
MIAAIFTLTRKILGESKWTLIVSLFAGFWFGWLSVFLAALAEQRIAQATGQSGGARSRILRTMAGGENVVIDTAAIETQFWAHPFVWLPIIVWAIARAAQAVAGEVERGTMDLVLSRPLTRWGYWLAQVLAGLTGIILIPLTLLIGNQVGARFNYLAEPPSPWVLLRPIISQIGLGFAVFGATLALSALDRVRWRPTLIISVLTLASYAGWVIAISPLMGDSPAKPWILNSSIFTAYNPVEAVTQIANWGRHVTALTSVGLVGLVIGYALFRGRDIPTSS